MLMQATCSVIHGWLPSSDSLPTAWDNIRRLSTQYREVISKIIMFKTFPVLREVTIDTFLKQLYGLHSRRFSYLLLMPYFHHYQYISFYNCLSQPPVFFNRNVMCNNVPCYTYCTLQYYVIFVLFDMYLMYISNRLPS